MQSVQQKILNKTLKPGPIQTKCGLFACSHIGYENKVGKIQARSHGEHSAAVAPIFV